LKHRRLQAAGVLALFFIFAIALVVRTSEVAVLADGGVITMSSRSSADSLDVERAGIALDPGDVVEEVADDALVVRRAKDVTLTTDGRSLAVRTQAETVSEVLVEAGVSLGPQDSLLLDGNEISAASQVPEAAPAALEVRRAVPVTVVENGHEIVTETSAGTVEQVLSDLDIQLGPGDLVRPALDAPMSAGVQVQVDRARQLLVTLPEGKAVLYTHEESVGPAIASSALSLPSDFRLEPSDETQISAGLAVRVVGISEGQDLETVRIESQTLYEPDPSLPSGTTRVVEGQDGILHRQYEYEYENDVLISSVLVDEYYDPEPVDTIIYYSTAPAPTPVPVPAPAPAPIAVSTGGWEGIVCSYDWDCDWALAVIYCESGGNPNAYNPAGYVGLFQIWEGNGSNLSDPATNIAAAYSLYVSGGPGNWPNCP